jgi:hypothetical protein
VTGARPAVSRAIGCLLAFAAGGASAAPADGACPGRFDAAAGPLAGGSEVDQPADFGAVPEACPGSELSLRLRGELYDASAAPDFAGRIVAGATARGRRRIGARSAISIAIDFLTYRYVNNAGVAGTGASFGPATLGYHFLLTITARTAVSAYARALLPIDTARQNGQEAGLELGAAGRARLSRRWLADGGVSLADTLTVTGGVARDDFYPGALAELWFAPGPAFALFGGGSLRLEAAPAFTLVSLVPRLGLRAALSHGLWLAFLAEAPVAGRDNTNAVASIFLGWTP